MIAWKKRFSLWGKAGNKVRNQRLSKARRKEIAKQAANARWGKK